MLNLNPACAASLARCPKTALQSLTMGMTVLLAAPAFCENTSHPSVEGLGFQQTSDGPHHDVEGTGLARPAKCRTRSGDCVAGADGRIHGRRSQGVLYGIADF